MHNNYYKQQFHKLNSLISILTVVLIIVNTSALFTALALSSTFIPYYGSIAKQISSTNNWFYLLLLGHDWLDKPHLPFWLSALSFKLFGISGASYALPGFLFHCLGAYYTYRLTLLLYPHTSSDHHNNAHGNTTTNASPVNIGLLASLIYLSTLHLMLSSIDVRAEAYLLGEIMAACYYWLLYDRQGKWQHLILGSSFTAMALMTKGIFVLITIISGQLGLWFYNKTLLKNICSFKWLSALTLSIALTFPELIALYLQFDAHPDKLMFGTHGVSGIKWFFIDSQFGRFFNTGPIMSTHPEELHQLYFIHTFLWAFLPWWPIFIYGVFSIVKQLFKTPRSRGVVFTMTAAEHNTPNNDNASNLYVLSAFFITFILFSITTFQVDHYTNILFPFASIICANYLAKMFNTQGSKDKILMYSQTAISIILFIASVSIAIVLQSMWYGATIILAASTIFILYKKYYQRRYDNVYYAILVLPVIAMCLLFIGATSGINSYIGYAHYDAGYKIAKYLNDYLVQNKEDMVISYNIDQTTALSLNFNLAANAKYVAFNDTAEPSARSPQPTLYKKHVRRLFVVLKQQDLNMLLAANVLHFKDSTKPPLQIIMSFNGMNFNDYIRELFSGKLRSKTIQNTQQHYLLVDVLNAD